jgi:AcrR family transcriptional regulator
MSSHDLGSGRSNGGTRPARKPRADGEQSRRTILHAAAQLATTRGLEGLSIGALAEHVGMSKSGLYAHFKSKEELELATIETAAEIFDRDVLEPARESPGGLSRVLALSEAFLRHLERRVFPGGCFFANVSMQLASQPGRPRERVMEILMHWMELFTRALGEAVAGGELPRDTDIDQMAFELNAMLVRANFNWILTGEPGVMDQARDGIRHVIERVTGRSGCETQPLERRSAPQSRRSHA